MPSTQTKDTIELYLTKVEEGDSFVLLTDGTYEGWIPKSLILEFSSDPKHDASGYYRVSEWTAKMRRWI